MKKKLIALLTVSVLCCETLTFAACSSSTAPDSDTSVFENADEDTANESENTFDQLLPFSFSTDDYYGNFLNFCVTSSITVEDELVDSDSAIMFVSSPNNFDGSASVAAFANSYNQVSYIMVRFSHADSELAQAAISAIDKSLDFSSIDTALSFDTPPESIEDLRETVEDGIVFTLTDSTLTIRRDDETQDTNKSSTIYSDVFNDTNIDSSIDSKDSDISLSKSNALDMAEDYLDVMAFSYEGLIEQLEYEGFSNEDATYAADNCGADWNEQSAKMAQSYLDTMSFSRSGLIEQLEYEGFTSAQAEYGVKAVGY